MRCSSEKQNTTQGETLLDRVTRLEAYKAATTALAASGAACDEGPYGPSASDGWHQAGVFVTDGQTFHGRSELESFFASLSTPFTLHIFTNFEALRDTALTAPTVRCYGLEAPVLGITPHFGAFIHDIGLAKTDGQTSIRRWHQQIVLITPTLIGWVRGARIADQTS